MSDPKPPAIADELLERGIRFLDGPVNRRLERVLKSRWLLAPLGLSVTLSARATLAWRERALRALWARRPLPPELGVPFEAEMPASPRPGTHNHTPKADLQAARVDASTSPRTSREVPHGTV